MGDGLVVQKSGLIERLDSKPGAISSDNPFYWYIHLQSLGKRAQTKEMVEEAVNGFNVDNHAYTILDYFTAFATPFQTSLLQCSTVG